MGRLIVTSGEDQDLLAASEEAEFAASVKAARARADARLTEANRAPVRSPDPPEEEEIAWTEQEDVYRPRPINARAYLASIALPRSVHVQPGQSFALVRKDAYQLLCGHLKSDVTIELGGLLCGEALYDREADTFIVVIETALPALNGDGTSTTFSYTPAAWEAMFPALQQMSKDRTIVGSYHSHPGMGVFLSSTDLHTQAEVFPHDWQVALVVDPVANTSGFFIGASGKPCRSQIV